MIIVIGVSLLLCVGVIIIVIDDMSIFGPIGAVFGGAFLLVCLIVIPVVRVDGRNTIIGYEQDLAYIKTTVVNDEMTGEERAKAIALAISNNKEILKTREWRDNPMIGWFVYSPIGDLDLFDVEAINEANTVITIKSEM